MSRPRSVGIGMVLLATVLLLGCEEDRVKRPYGGGGFIPGGSTSSQGKKDGGSVDGSAIDAGQDLVAPDGPITCVVDCDCAQGLRCTSFVCTQELSPFYCCDKTGCPDGQLCTDINGLPGICGL